MSFQVAYVIGNGRGAKLKRMCGSAEATGLRYGNKGFHALELMEGGDFTIYPDSYFDLRLFIILSGVAKLEQQIKRRGWNATNRTPY